MGPGTPAMGWGYINKTKVLQDPDPNAHTAATIRKEVLTPPPQQKRGTRVQKPYVGVCYVNDPKKRGGGIRRLRLRLI